MNIPNWFYDERVQKIAPEKLKLLLSMAEQLEGKTSQKEIMPVVMGAITSANRRNLFRAVTKRQVAHAPAFFIFNYSFV